MVIETQFVVMGKFRNYGRLKSKLLPNRNGWHPWDSVTLLSESQCTMECHPFPFSSRSGGSKSETQRVFNCWLASAKSPGQ